MEDTYDVIILGTGLKECILSGILSTEGKKVLHMDRNDYYGGESASLNLNQLYDKYKKGTKAPASLGESRHYNVDVVPKFLMASGALVNILVKTDVTRYLDFKSVDGSYVFQKKAEGLLGGMFSSDGIHKVPSTSTEALSSSLMSLMEKKRCASFMEWVGDFDPNDKSTWKKWTPEMSSKQVFDLFGLEAKTVDFLGHAMALWNNDDYLQDKTKTVETMKRIKTYGESVLRYGNSPYIYPLFGLGEMPQGFARLSAIYGGTYMLNKPIEEIIYDSNGKVCGVKSEGEVAKCSMVIGDPSYFPDKCQKVGQVARKICILDHPVKDTHDASSCQIIIPQKAVGRKYDIYISVVSAAHNVAPKGKWIAIISTTVETDNPEKELEPAMKILGKVDESFFFVNPIYNPTTDGSKDNVFISKSFDPETHFGVSCQDIVNMYKRITGKDYDPTPKSKEEEK
eukprot:TRINITY_DN5056_c0_g1_i1.p1 TRINITY_DN5056_c0_g1~~TRINITY_DN5056_c0_g1_i1.p1  ORF type:complete len:454 (-),score=79.27 TRINITY_DN5056_c0_g1_i1:62-1423(-)